ncbi:tetratricopeptide repeat protein [Candidatus Uabimicrobium sp. HlEnr_7]|uniref:protein kinase domain-containing protein n=1 Tax=Candidatus Uabimicrobium helgolandensis TaxID=3095367 RepID=UPI003557CA2D
MSVSQDPDKTVRFNVQKNFYTREQDAYAPLAQGSYFGRYLVNKELGRGGMGIVYQAYDPQMKRIIALKVIMNKNAGNRQRFFKESQTMAQLNHPNIVRFYEFAEFPQLHFTMEYIEGVSLTSLIKERCMKTSFLVGILRQVCQACSHAHNNNILHRDIKPANIIVDKEGQTKLLDFGLAKSIHGQQDLTNTGEALGTTYYMAPEQLEGNPNKKSDIYSFGATLYEALTWRTVYQGTTNINIIVQILEKPPIPPHQLNPEVCPYLEAICLKAISRSPRRRYESFRQLDIELKNYQHKRPIIARQYTKMDSIHTLIKQHKLLFSFIIVFFTTVIGFSAFLAMAYEKLQTKEIELHKSNNELRKLNRAMVEALDYARHSEDHHSLFFDASFLKPLKEIFKQSMNLKTAEDYGFLRGLVLGQTGNDKEVLQAISDYNNVIKNNPKSALSYYNRALLYEKRKDYTQALRDYDTSIALNSNYARAYYNRARMREETKNYQKAVNDYTKAIAINPQFYQAYHNRGRLFMLEEKYLSSTQDFKRAIEYNSNYHRAYATRGDLLERQGKLQEAVNSYSTAIGIKPNIYSYYINRAYLHRLQKNYALAHRDYEQARNIEPKNFMAYSYAGMTYQMQGSKKKAFKFFNRALELNPRDAGTRLSRGILLQLAGKLEKALDDYQRALRDEPQQKEGYYLRGNLFLQLGKYHKALADWNKAVELSHSESQQLMKKIQELKAALRENN